MANKIIARAVQRAIRVVQYLNAFKSRDKANCEEEQMHHCVAKIAPFQNCSHYVGYEVNRALQDVYLTGLLFTVETLILEQF